MLFFLLHSHTHTYKTRSLILSKKLFPKGNRYYAFLLLLCVKDTEQKRGSIEGDEEEEALKTCENLFYVLWDSS